MNDADLKLIRDYYDAIDVGMLNERGLRGYADNAAKDIPKLLQYIDILREWVKQVADGYCATRDLYKREME